MGDEVAGRPGVGTAPAQQESPTDRAKRALRARIRAQRRGRSQPLRSADADAIARVLLEQQEVRSARCVAAYVSMPGEPGTGPLRAALKARSIRILLPIVLEHGVLDWAYDEGPLQPGRMRLGGDEPAGPRLGTAAIGLADVLIIPALAVDTLGSRLGQGSGYYDRALRLVDPSVMVIAVVFEEELLDAAVEAVPFEAHDHPVHAVVTPYRCLRLLPNPF